jgi:hypothetical protein
MLDLLDVLIKFTNMIFVSTLLLIGKGSCDLVYGLFKDEDNGVAYI